MPKIHISTKGLDADQFDELKQRIDDLVENYKQEIER